MAIKYIDIIHHSHTDFGYTDHPMITHEIHKSYIDIAIDAIEATSGNREGEGFCWTAEVLLPVYEWWLEADDEKRKKLLNAINSGRFEVMGLPFNNTALLNDSEWDRMLSWVPDELWERLKPKACMQIDVNGMPRAGIMRAIKKGIRYLWIGPNSYNGASPFGSPFAFRWKMPDGNSIFTWINPGYCDAFYLFNENWRQGPVPKVSDLRYRQPDSNDIFVCTEEKLLESHRICLENLKTLENDNGMCISKDKALGGNTLITRQAGYPYERLPASLTNQWRLDNDPPFTGITEFINKWNEMGLKPELRLTTPSVALSDLECEIGDRLPEYSGEWVDWWANGSASMPAEISASRKAKRLYNTIKSGIFGKLDVRDNIKAAEILKNLCMFDEHTWGSWGSIAYPYDIATRMQTAEKSCFAYRALAAAEFLLAQKARSELKDKGNGIRVTNASEFPASGWVELPVDCFRGDFTHIQDSCTGEIRKFIFDEGTENFKRPETAECFSMENVAHTFSDKVPGRKVRFWSGDIGAGCTTSFIPLKKSDCPVSENISYYSAIAVSKDILTNHINMSTKNKSGRLMDVSLDDRGWPDQAIWSGMKKPLFEAGLGEFLSYTPIGFAPRWIMKDIFETSDQKDRRKKRQDSMKEQTSVFTDSTIYKDTPYTTSYEQVFSHPSLDWGIRKLEIWKDEPRIRLTVKINRRSSMEPEIFYIRFPLPCDEIIPDVSSGGISFKPGVDQLPGSCMDYYAIDGWAQYGTSEGNWIWSSLDAPLITFESPNAVARLDKLPKQTHILLSMVFDNTWDTNFAADSHGIMEFKYDLAWRESSSTAEASRIAESLARDFVVKVDMSG